MDLRGECVAVVAAGPSLRLQDLSVLRDRIHVVVVNESYQLCPWAEILYSCDTGWWKLRQVDIGKKFRGLKVTFETNVSILEDVKRIEVKKTDGDEYVNDMLF